MTNISLQSDGEISDEILFDANRDNAKEGISPDQMISMLKMLQQETNSVQEPGMRG